jgi:hypothetical protein
MKRLKLLLFAAIVATGSFLLLPPTRAIEECSGMCPGGSFPCCCNGTLIGCATTILQCWDAC